MRIGRGVVIAAFLVSCVAIYAQTNNAGRAAGSKGLKRIHVFVSGKVQGVGFRAFTSQTVVSLKLEVKGWVKNLADGRVEIVAEGSEADLEKFMKEVAKGPKGSNVDKLEQKEEPYTGEFKEFKVAG
jgi:acylphosphatase